MTRGSSHSSMNTSVVSLHQYLRRSISGSSCVPGVVMPTHPKCFWLEGSGKLGCGIDGGSGGGAAGGHCPTLIQLCEAMIGIIGIDSGPPWGDLPGCVSMETPAATAAEMTMIESSRRVRRGRRERHDRVRLRSRYLQLVICLAANRTLLALEAASERRKDGELLLVAIHSVL